MSKERSMTRRTFATSFTSGVAGLAVGVALGYVWPREGPTHDRKKVLLIFSYHPEYSWVVEETRGVEEAFEDKGLLVEKFYMDMKRKTSKVWIRKVREEAAKRIEESGPDLVIVFDDDACAHVAQEYVGRALPFVFCGMNGDPAEYSFPVRNITGVIERHHVRKTLELVRQLVPYAKKAAIVTDDSTASQGFIKQVRKLQAGTELPIPISEVYATDDFNLWKRKVMELQTRVDAIGILGYHTVKADASEESLPSSEVLNWTLENSKLPDFSGNDFAVRGGVLCGVTLSGYEQGKAAGETAVKILLGTSPGDITIKSPSKGNTIINIDRAEALNITIPEEVLERAELVH